MTSGRLIFPFFIRHWWQFIQTWGDNTDWASWQVGSLLRESTPRPSALRGGRMVLKIRWKIKTRIRGTYARYKFQSRFEVSVVCIGEGNTKEISKWKRNVQVRLWGAALCPFLHMWLNGCTRAKWNLHYREECPRVFGEFKKDWFFRELVGTKCSEEKDELLEVYL